MLENLLKVQPGPPKPSGLIEPRVFSLPIGTERYVIEGASAALIPIFIGDKICIENDEGGQVCELLACTHRGHVDPMVLGIKGQGKAFGLQALLIGDDPSLRSLKLGIEARGIDLNSSGAAYLFETTSPAGTTETFIASHDGAVILATPLSGSNGFMDLEAQNTATPLTVTVTRAKIQRHTRFKLPDPLANPVHDIRVHSQSAEAYFVKAGDYVQILDVEGRQCTDFQCFSARKLDQGIEHALDVTTTRTLIGHSYPMPGLHGKYYDQDMLPLIEVIQDTCGRHDAFALACAAKYYDDIGYPGHANCSDNFNGALAPYGVAERAGWMAINFFFNTDIDAHGVMHVDEPWSRPGDYVLLRALTDIVCVSSACPDDTTAANGWNPTDIHVRTYAGHETFKRSVAIRATPDAEPKMSKESGFQPSFAKYTRNFVEYNGYWMPNCFASEGPIAEYIACRQDAVIMDLSPLRKFEITGPDAEALCQYVFTRNMKTLPIGGVVYTAMCYDHGGMIDDGTVFRLGRDNFRWIGGADYGGIWLREQAVKLDLKVLVRSSTDQLHNVAVQGPKSRDILRDVIWTAPHNPTLDQLGWFRFSPARLFDAEGVAVVISRTGYTGELGYEIMCHPKHCTEVFDAIWQVGKPYGLKPMGLEALDMVRIEAGLIFAGYDFSDQTDPFEAGIGFTVPLKSKADNFIGRDALIRRKENPMKKLVGLDIGSEIEVGQGDCIYVGRAQVGEVTSAIRSPLLGRNIAMARVDVSCSTAGTHLEIGKLDGHQKRLPAIVRADLAAYDPKKEKPRS